MIKKSISFIVILLCFLSISFLTTSCGQKTAHYKYTGKVYSGTASWYGKKFHGRKTASGERYNMYKYTAAHRKLPFGTKLLVKNTSNNKRVVVKVNDRGPYVRGRVLDLSYAAAKKLDFIRSGHTKIKFIILN